MAAASTDSSICSSCTLLPHQQRNNPAQCQSRLDQTFRISIRPKQFRKIDAVPFQLLSRHIEKIVQTCWPRYLAHQDTFFFKLLRPLPLVLSGRPSLFKRLICPEWPLGFGRHHQLKLQVVADAKVLWGALIIYLSPLGLFQIITSAPIGAWKWNALLRNYYRGPTDRPTDRRRKDIRAYIYFLSKHSSVCNKDFTQMEL